MNLRIVGTPTEAGPTNMRVVDVDTDDTMTADERLLGPDGKPLGWSFGRPTANAQPHCHRCGNTVTDDELWGVCPACVEAVEAEILEESK